MSPGPPRGIGYNSLSAEAAVSRFADGATPSDALVDVVIPLYNKKHVVARAIESALRQRDAAVRVVIVDDGSTDGPDAALARYKSDSRVAVIHQKNQGPGAARNAGARAGAAPFLAFLDADDEWDVDFLSSALESMRGAEGAAVVTTGWRRGRSDGSIDPKARFSPPQEHAWVLNPRLPYAHIKERIDSIHSSACLVRRTVFSEFGGFFEKGCTYGEDAFLWARIAFGGRTIVSIPRTLINFHTDASSLSAGRTDAYPVPPLLTNWRQVVGSAPTESEQRDVAGYLSSYARFVVGRARRQRAHSTLIAALRSWAAIVAYRSGILR